jgi:hypothetical protein
MKIRWLFPFVFFGVLLLAHAAQAQEVTVFAGGLVPGSGSFRGVSTPLDRGPIFGVRLTTGFAASWKLEGTLAYSNDFLFPREVPGVTHARAIVFNYNLLANIPVGKAVPYATAGLGFVHQYGSDNLPVGTKLAVNYGGGLKFPKLWGPAGLRIDARGYTAIGVFSYTVNIFELSGGVLFSF